MSLDMATFRILEESCIGWCTWERDDLANALEVQGVEPTEENIEKLSQNISKSYLSDAMCEAGWDVIYSAIHETFKEDI